MPIHYSTYSDVSYSAHLGKMIFAAVVLCEGDVADRWTGMIEDEKCTSVAEVLASIIACEKVPSRSRLTVFTDIPSVLDALNRVLSQKRKFHIAVSSLVHQLRRMESWEVKIVSRSDKHYQWCHREAWKTLWPERFATWQYWRAQKENRPQRATYSIEPILAEAMGGK